MKDGGRREKVAGSEESAGEEEGGVACATACFLQCYVTYLTEPQREINVSAEPARTPG